MKMRKFKKGFTLVELVVVIAVIAVLAAVSVGAYFGVTDSANSSNAAATVKQIRDLWTLYTADEYDDSVGVFESAKDFCLRFVEELGPSNDVNFDIVSVKSKGDVQSSLGDNSSDSAILFKVETTYPTWFLVNDKIIIEESSTSLKTNKSFNDSLLESKRLILDDELKNLMRTDDEFLYPFEIQVVGTDANNNPVRGFKNYKVDVKKLDSNNVELNNDKPVIYLEPGENLYFYDNSLVINKVNLPSEMGEGTYLSASITDSFGNEVDTKEPLNLEDHLLETIDTVDNLVPGKTFTYFVNKEYVVTKKTLVPENVNLETYPICLVQFENSTSQEPDKLLKEEWIDEAPEEKGIYFNKRTIYTRKLVQTYFPKDNSISFDFYTSLDEVLNDIKSIQSSNSTKELFLYLYNVTIDKPIVIPENVYVVLDYYSDFDNISNYVYENSSNLVEVTTTYTQEKSGYVTGSYPDNNSISWDGVQPSKPVSTVIKNEILFNKLSENTNRLGNYDTVDKTKYENSGWFDRSEDAVKNTLTINNGASLTLSPNSYLLNEAHIALPGYGEVIGVGNRSTIHNNGKIILNNANMKVLGELTSDNYTDQNNGIVTATNNSTVFELFKIYDYFGGTHTANITHKNISVFPFCDYKFDNIKGRVDIDSSSTLCAVTGFSMLEGVNFITDPVNLVSSQNNSVFTSSDDSSIVKSCDNDGHSTFSIYGTISDGSFNLPMDYTFIYKHPKVASLGALGAGAIAVVLGTSFRSTIDSTNFNFGFSNMDVVINKDAHFIIDNKNSTYNVFHTSNIKIYGNVTITNGANICVVGQEEFISILNKGEAWASNPGSSSDLPRITKFASISNDEIIYIDESGSLILGTYSNDQYGVDGNLYVSSATKQTINGTIDCSDIVSSESIKYEYITVSDGIGVEILSVSIGTCNKSFINIPNYRNA